MYKKLSVSMGLRPLTPHQGLCPWTPLVAPPPNPRLGSRSVRSPWSPPLANPGSATESIPSTYMYNVRIPVLVGPSYGYHPGHPGVFTPHLSSTSRPRRCCCWFYCLPPDSVVISSQHRSQPAASPADRKAMLSPSNEHCVCVIFREYINCSGGPQTTHLDI